MLELFVIGNYIGVFVLEWIGMVWDCYVIVILFFILWFS